MNLRPMRTRRVLFIARYRSAAMESKLHWMAQDPDIELRLVRPALWADEYGQVSQVHSESSLQTTSIPMLGAPSDPHRAVYRTVDFGVSGWAPDIVHAEEEPDSLATLQIAIARRLLWPQARLFLHTWQNVDRPKPWYVRAVMRTTLNAADAVFCANQAAVTLLQRYNYRKPTPLIPAIGVDTELFRPRSAAPAPTQEAVAGYVGRFTVEKGIKTLLDALDQLRQTQPQYPVQVKLIGDGMQRAELAEYAAGLGIQDQVTFVPALPADRVVEEIQDLSMLVLPSLSTEVWQEQLGRVLLEAMACGVPVIGSNSGAIPEVIGDAGLIFPEGNAIELAKRMQKIMADADLRDRCARRGVQRVNEHYSQQVLAAKTIAFYRQVLP